ncbi:MAG: YchJ family protein [Deltaproteobacteria bacterium]|nr:MAG: YchJ family protein [Deltaproteobacteria bacterium]
MSAVQCPCGNDAEFDRCCGPLIRGEASAETAEQLMRSRYSAYATGAVDYILQTHDPATAGDVDRDATEAWSKSAEWLGLEIVATEAGGPDDDEGVVEFVARYRLRGADAAHHERAQFRRCDGRWVFVDGALVKPKTVVRDAPKIGRNDPCPCGSGAKYKRCCGR